MPVVELTLLYDSTGLTGYQTGWGLSFWVEIPSESRVILFDTGWNGTLLLNNINRSGKDLAKITDIFLTHNHWDHVGGVVFLLAHKFPDLRSIIVPSSFSTHFKEEIGALAPVVSIKTSKQPIELFRGVYSTGELGSQVKEQSLIIKLPRNQLLLITGCAHPQIDVILNQAEILAPVSYIVGGFHDFNKLDVFKNRFVVPVHCTKEKENILSHYPRNTKSLKVGETIKI